MKRIFLAVAGYAFYRWWNKRSESPFARPSDARQAARKDDRGADI